MKYKIQNVKYFKNTFLPSKKVLSYQKKIRPLHPFSSLENIIFNVKKL